MARRIHRRTTSILRRPCDPGLARSAVFALGALLRLPAFGRPLLSDDEAIYAATAAAMSPGRSAVPGRGRSQAAGHLSPVPGRGRPAGRRPRPRGPPAGAAGGAGHRARCCGGWRLPIPPGQPAAPAGAAAAAGLFLCSPPPGTTTTPWRPTASCSCCCPRAVAALLLLRAVDTAPDGARPLPWHLAIGLLVGLSALCKYQGLTFLGVSAGLLAWAVLTGPDAGSARRAGAGAAGAGRRCLPAALYLAWASRPTTRRPRPSAGSLSTSPTWAPG